MLLRYLQQCATESGRMPTQREIAEHFRLRTTSSLRVLLDRLEQQGFLTRDPLRARGIRLTQMGQPRRGLPVVGFVQAGPLTEAEEVVAGYLEAGEDFDPERHFCLIVRGDSMIDAHIADGDVAVIRRQPTCENGQIAVALVNHEATLKRVFKERRQLRLEPANRRLKPFTVTDATICGVLVRVIRDYRV